MIPGDQSDFAGGGAPEPVVGEVVALRQFRLNGLVLVGLTSPQPALDGVNVARCWHPTVERPRHPGAVPPVSGCSCGFYAYDDSRLWVTTGLGVVTAAVALSGRVIVCARGLKAEKMRVLAVVEPTPVFLRFDRDGFSQNYPGVELVATEADLIERYPLTPLTAAVRERHRAAPEDDEEPPSWASVITAVSNAVSSAVSTAVSGAVSSAVPQVVAALPRLFGLPSGQRAAMSSLLTSGALAVVNLLQSTDQGRGFVEGTGVRPDGVLFEDVAEPGTVFEGRGPAMPPRPRPDLRPEASER